MRKIKICVVTSSRADYGLFYWVLKSLQSDVEFELQLVATGSHLSNEFGFTRNRIIEDGFSIAKDVEILLAADTPYAVSKAMGLANICFADVFRELQPDLVLILGDRFEMLAVASVAHVANIPIAHFHGGELTEGAMDDAFRHAITKMAHLHFTATEEYRMRVIQLGESPQRVFKIGALGIENIKRLSLLDKADFELSIGFELRERNLLVTYHPDTLDYKMTSVHFAEILAALSELHNTGLIFTMPNADTGGRIVWGMIRDFVALNVDRAVCFENLGQLRYLSALRHVDAVVGNSSSGIIEAPSFKIGTINIGERQKGRVRSGSVIDCSAKATEISAAITLLYSEAFQQSLRAVDNPYDCGVPLTTIVQILKTEIRKGFNSKSFFDVDFRL